MAIAPKAAGAGQDSGHFPCVSCLVLEVEPSVAEAAPAEEDVPVAIAVRLRPRAELGASIPPRASVLIADSPDTDALSTTAAVFSIRSFITAARAARPDLIVVADADALGAAGIPLTALEGYVDGIIGHSWRRAAIPPVPSLDDLIDASLTPGAERVVVTPAEVDWDVLRAFASRRAQTVDVAGTRVLTASEIVARHQAVRQMQAAAVQSTIARGTTTLLFEVPGMVAPVTITAETTVFARSGVTEMEQRNIRVNGAAIAGGGGSSAPRLPLLEPERISSPPLTITLSDAYAYTLAGEDEVNGRRVYVIAFRPRGGAGRGAAHGRAWIDATDFGLWRLESIQAGLRGPIVSSEQIDEFEPFSAGQTMVRLPVRTRVFQMYEGAGQRTPIHRVLTLGDYDINSPEFDAQLAQAYASPHVMLRDTPEGFRYLLRERETSDGTRRVAADAGHEVRAVVAGVLIDPSISDPLPFAGISYVNLNAMGTGAQVNAFFGGAYAQLSWSVPSVGGSAWQLHGSAFAIAARYNDRAFRGGVEQYRENIRQRPARASVAAVRAVSPRARLRLAYQLDVTAFSRADTTATAFVVPDTAIVHGMLGELSVVRGAWTLRAWEAPAVRQGWHAWGMAPVLDAPIRTYFRYGGSATRTIALRRAVSSRLEIGWTDGARLDRFSRYSFDSFDNRLHGYPTATIRYDRGVVARTVTSWNGRGWRVDAFADAAAVHQAGDGDPWHGHPGVGAALEAAGPLRTLWSVEWGYGINARNARGERGTHAVRITAYRMF